MYPIMWKNSKQKIRQMLGKRIIFLSGMIGLFLVLAASGFLLKMEIGVIRLYRQVGSPVSRQVITCRYQLSCSRYALSSLQTEGFWRGNGRIAQRLVMCSPIGWVIDKVRGKDTSGDSTIEPGAQDQKGSFEPDNDCGGKPLAHPDTTLFLIFTELLLHF